jgi:SAM-dependent methyltransferase
MQDLRVPMRLRRGALKSDEDASIESAAWLIDHMCEHVGLADLGDTEVLDFGCGVKFTQALINRSLPIKRYVGVDIDSEMIRFLDDHVADPRFEHHYVDVQNDLYNPNGEPLSKTTRLPIEGQAFDLICLFSVFTHLAPHDYRALLELLRRFAKPDGKLFFSLFIDQQTDGGHGLIDQWKEAVSRMPRDELARLLEADPEAAQPIETFRDLDPREPLRLAVYSERYARELITGTGWEIVELAPPDVYIQHHFLCAAR